MAASRPSRQVETAAAGPLPEPRAGEGAMDLAFWALFTRADEGWTGGDSTSSVLLPDGRTVWLFSDTFLGPVNLDHSRPRSAPLIHNSMVVQDGDTLTTLYGGSPKAPRALFTPADGGAWYWAHGAMVEGDHLRVFLLKFVRTGADMFAWRWLGLDVASLRLPELRLEGVTSVPVRNGVRYGVAFLEGRDYTYVYGVEDLSYAKYGHVARARRGALLGPWEFFTGRSWSSSPDQSARMLEVSIGNEFSVIRVEGGCALITFDTSRPLLEWRDVVAYFSPRPTGPWTDRTVLYTASEPDHENWFVYNAHAHPQFSHGAELLVTYNVNSLRFDDLYADADLYRARFVRVALPDALG